MHMRKYMTLLCIVLSVTLISGCEKGISSNPNDSSSIASEATSGLVLTDSNITSQPISANTSGSAMASYPFIQSVYGVIDAEVCGPRIYTGTDPFRIYPNPDSPFAYDNYKTDYVQVIQTVQSGRTPETRQKWCLVTDTFMGYTGYVRSSELKPVEDKYDYGKGYETLGGYKMGDRIETLIGKMDQDYYLVYDHGLRSYIFPDSKYNTTVGEKMLLNVISDTTNHVGAIITNSPEFSLKDGYKVGDKASIVIEFYKKKYTIVKEYEGEPVTPDTLAFEMPDKKILYFYIDTDNLTDESKILRISIIPSLSFPD